MEKCLAVPQKLNMELPWLKNSTPRYIPKRNESQYSHKNLYIKIHSNCIPNSQKVETTQCPSADKWITKWVKKYPYKGILFTYKMELSTDKCYNTDES